MDGLRDAAVRLATALEYVGAGTVEFLVDVDQERFVFLEVNARVQVEHPVTEMVTGVDIVREQLRIAAGGRLSVSQDDVRITGHAIECRINAEDPANGFLPSPGRDRPLGAPGGRRRPPRQHCHAGYAIPPFYDSLLGKLIVLGEDRPAALALMGRALERFRVEGVATTIPLHRAVVGHPDFVRRPPTTRWLEEEFLPTWTQEA